MAKSKRKRQRRRGRSGGHPARRAPVPRRSSAEAELERMARLALVEARRRAQEALSAETPPERVAALVVEEFEDLPSPPGLATRLRRDGSEQRARSVAGVAMPACIRYRTSDAATSATDGERPFRSGRLRAAGEDVTSGPPGRVRVVLARRRGLRRRAPGSLRTSTMACLPSPPSGGRVFNNREGTPPSSTGASTTSGYSSRSASAPSRVVLPIPASPHSTSARPDPARRSSTSASSASSSCVRPTITEPPRSTADPKPQGFHRCKAAGVSRTIGVRPLDGVTATADSRCRRRS